MNKSLSQKIETARIICILSLVYVHFPPSYGVIPLLFNNDSQFWVAFISNSIGRNSVPLLSIISGYLIISSLSKRGFKQVIHNKLYTLILPLLLWNIASLIKDYCTGVSPLENKNLINYLLSIYDTPGILPLYFLRDIFMCVIITPILVFFHSQSSKFIILSLLFTFPILNVNNYLFINDTIVGFFYIGILIKTSKFNLNVFEQPFYLVISGLTLFLVTIFSLNPELTSANSILSIISRFAGAIMFWNIACNLSRNVEITNYCSNIFFTFCIHTLIIGIVWKIAQKTGIEAMTPSYTLLFLISPFIILLISNILFKFGSSFSPKILALFIGRK